MRAHGIYKKRRRRNSLRYFVCGMVMAGAAILVVIGGTVFVSGKRPKDEKGNGISENIGVDSDELLTLVNAEHPMPSEWQCELVQLNNGQNIDSRAYEDLQQMMDTARAEGYDPYICSSWRSHETQVRLFEEEIQSYKKQGYSEREAEVQAAQWVAVPGTSEHELGLALDIVSVENQRLKESQENTPTQQWLMEHCYEYGFILRYPKDKEDITGIGYEPWHYRYVGQEHARVIHESGVCLEEYVAHR